MNDIVIFSKRLYNLLFKKANLLSLFHQHLINTICFVFKYHFSKTIMEKLGLKIKKLMKICPFI